jgi:hypothetical protein
MRELLELISSFGLETTFPNLFTLYQAACTIPTSSASAERSFSKLKIIKNRLRTTIEEKRLEDLMILACEIDIDVDINLAVDRFASSSDVYKKHLVYH